jgi:hypothetical protein
MTYDITVKNGDTFRGVTFTILVNAVAMDLTDYDITMTVKQDNNTPIVFTKLLGSGITITSAAEGKFKIDKQIFPEVAPFRYKYDIELKNRTTSIDVYTYITGYFSVTEDIT